MSKPGAASSIIKGADTDIKAAGESFQQVEQALSDIWVHHRVMLIVTCFVFAWQILIYGLAASNVLPGVMQTYAYVSHVSCTGPSVNGHAAICQDGDDVITLLAKDDPMAPYYMLCWSSVTLLYFVFGFGYSVITTVMTYMKTASVSKMLSFHYWQILAQELFKYQTLALFLIAFVLQLIKWESHGVVDLPYWGIAMFPAVSLLVTAAITIKQAFTGQDDVTAAVMKTRYTP